MSVRYALLGLLSQQPRHGYELHAEFEALVGGKDNWDVKPPQIYSTLARLEDSGLVIEDSVEKDGGPEKRVYAITPAGESDLQLWFSTPIASEHLHDEFFIKLMLTLPAGDNLTHQVIQAQRSTLYRELHRVTDFRQRADPNVDLAHILLMDKTVMHLEADLRWLDMVEARLDEMKRQPLPQREPRPRGRPPKAK
jgi:DNA-binding PadR family transcriptional regulator